MNVRRRRMFIALHCRGFFGSNFYFIIEPNECSTKQQIVLADYGIFTSLFTKKGFLRYVQIGQKRHCLIEINKLPWLGG